MKLLHFLFNQINPRTKVTWLSRQYHIWESNRQELQNRMYRNNINIPMIYFDVPGAGDICISEDCHHSTGKVVGFSFGVEWGRYGFSGGVIGRDEAKRMAEFILSKCNEVSETMEEERIIIKKKMNDYFDKMQNERIVS